jgi:hypothetical protein
MKGKSVSYVVSSNSTWVRRTVPKGYAHEQDYSKSDGDARDFGDENVLG